MRCVTRWMATSRAVFQSSIFYEKTRTFTVFASVFSQPEHPLFVNKILSPKTAQFGQENPHFWRFGDVLLLSGRTAVRVRLIMLNTACFRPILSVEAT